MGANPVDNHGERLVPGESYDRANAICHKSSYKLFKAIIEADVRKLGNGGGLRILDLGCGVGHGTLMLADGDGDGCEIVGVDASADAIDYASKNYGAANVTYVAAAAHDYLRDAGAFDYVVSRHALEHIPDGLRLALCFERRRRLIVNVPYMEPPHNGAGELTNPFHELNDISEADFADYPHAEFFFEDLQGVTTATPEAANSIVCVSSAPDLDPAAAELSLPFPAWKPNKLEQIALDSFPERVVMQATIEQQAEQLAQWQTAFDEHASAYRADIENQRADVQNLQAAFEERAALDEARLTELRTAYDQLAGEYRALRHARAVEMALRLRGLLQRLQRRRPSGA
ncbi:MAG TPA: methyltransferase domain-containing protein [Conexibacter sp.]|jgi:SAM-dependent methyltransferase|nr:methyltransferase domain-containing protein [Conexibacter sp.]